MPTKTSHPTTPLFKQDDAASSKSVTLMFEGQAIRAPQGVSVAAALLLNGIEPFRTTPVSGAPRAPYCMMGVCFDCLVEIDGVPSRQTCQLTVQDGMRVQCQGGAPTIEGLEQGARHDR